MLYIKDIPKDEKLDHYCAVKLGKYFNEENGCVQYFCRIRRCTQKRSSYCAYLAVQTLDNQVYEAEVNHFYHYKAFDQAVRKMNRKLQGIEKSCDKIAV